MCRRSNSAAFKTLKEAANLKEAADGFEFQVECFRSPENAILQAKPFRPILKGRNRMMPVWRHSTSGRIDEMVGGLDQVRQVQFTAAGRVGRMMMRDPFLYLLG